VGNNDGASHAYRFCCPTGSEGSESAFTVERSASGGMKVYRDGCSGCHGDYQKPSHWGTTAFYPRVPQFAKNAPDRPDWQMFWIVKHGVRYSGMAAWQGEIPDEKIWQVVTFLSRLRNLPPDVEADWTQPPVEKSR
jgi:mono/diheme cytochrome c family protein